LFILDSNCYSQFFLPRSRFARKLGSIFFVRSSAKEGLEKENSQAKKKSDRAPKEGETVPPKAHGMEPLQEGALEKG